MRAVTGVREALRQVWAEFSFLRFEKNSERAFLRYYHKKTIGQMRFAQILLTLSYSAVGLIDSFVVGDVITLVWPIRYLIVCPVLLLNLGLTLLTSSDRRLQLMNTLSLILGGVALVGIMALEPGAASQLYYAGLVVIIFYGHAMLRLRFGYAIISGWIITFSYLLVFTLLRNAPAAMVINNTFFLVVTNITGMAASYLLEGYTRKDYLQATQMKKTHRALHRLSLFDGLTKIPNRRMFDIRISAEFNSLKLTGQPLSLILVDIDHFKAFNDCLGHQAGDRCLVRVAEKLRGLASRFGDVAARYGGEEFAIIMGNASMPEARAVAEKMRDEIRALKIRHPESPIDNILTVSMGVSSINPSERNSYEDLFSAADAALYAAKKNGRDRVEAISAS